jgi:hypothetical protein
MNSTMNSRRMGGFRHEMTETTSNDVIELGLLMPANRAAELIRLAQARQESVGHLVRKLIDRELAKPF